MGLSDRKQTTKQSSTTANTYGREFVPDTPDIIAARESKPQIDPSIGYRLGEKERQLSDSFVSPTGGYVTPQIRDAIMRSERRGLMQQAGQQAREGQYDVNRLNQSKNLALASLTRPELVQRSSSMQGQGQTVQSQSPWATAAQIGGQVAPLSL